jgi:hypothetical protein
MAINFLNSVDLNKNQLIKAAIESQPNDAAVGTGVEGQLYFNTTQQTIKVYREILPATTPKTYEWGSISGDIEEVQESLVNGLLGINVLNPTGPIPVVGLDIVGLTALGTGVALTDSLAVYDLSTTTNKKLTVADIVGTSTWKLEGDGANQQTIVNGDVVDFVGDTYLTATASTTSANNFEVKFDHDDTTRTDTTSASSPGSAGTFTTVDSVTTNTTGHLTALNLKTITLPTSDNYVSWTLDGDTGTPQTILSGDTATFTGGTKISTAVAATDVLTITHDATTRTNTTSAVTANVFTVVDSFATDATGHVTSVDTKTVTVPDNNTTYTLPVSAGTVVSGHSVADIDLTDSTPSIVSKVTYAGLDNEIKITETIGNNGVINIALADGAYVDDTVGSGSNLVLPDGAVAVTQATADNSTKIATTEFVKLNVTGLLQFVGGFNANTGDRDSPLTGDLYTDVQLFVGDYYVVTTAGDFFGNTATPLTAGDSVIVQSDAAAGAAVEADFIVVQSDTDLATATTPGLGFVTATATSGIDVSYAANNGSAALTLDACELPSNAGTPVSLVGCDSGGNTKKFPIATVLAARGKKLVLEEVAGNGIVNSGLVGGVTTYTITLATAWQIDGSSAGVDGTDVQVEVTGSGQTVYAEINRTTTTITVAFTGAITDGDYVVLLNNVG